MTAVIKAKNPADMLALMPALLGFTPKQSVVLLPFRGNRAYGAMRLDLPGSGPPAVHKRLATYIVGTLCKLRGVDSVVLVVVTDAKFGAQSTPPSSDLVKTLRARFRQSGLGLKEALCLASDGWGSYLDDDTPAGGRPLSDVTNSAVTGAVPPEARREVDASARESRVPNAPPAEVQRVKEKFDRLRRRVDEADDDDHHVPREFEALQDVPNLMEAALEWNDEEIASGAALLLFAWQGPPLRDMTMLQWATEMSVGDLILDENESMIRSDPTAPSKTHQFLGGLMMGIGPRPDPDRIERGIRLVRAVVARAEDEQRVAPLCMLTWLCWALGHGSEAGRYLDEAASIRPDYGMVEVLSAILGNGMMPEWAFSSYGPAL